MNELNMVIGQGPVGATVAALLAARGGRVRTVTRSGAGGGGGVEAVRADALDPESLRGLFDGATAVYDCLHAGKYTDKEWQRVLPATDRNVRAEAARTGALIVYPESLYSYAPPTGPITEGSPRRPATAKGHIRAALIEARLADAQPVAIVAASDFYGPHARKAHAGDRMLAAVTGGKTLRVLGSAAQPHSFTYVPDLAAAMIAAASRPELWNRILLAPTVAPLTQRELAGRYAAAAGVGAPTVAPLPGWLLRGAGLALPEMAGIAEMDYQFTRPFTVNSAWSEAALGLAPTPLEDGVAATMGWWRTRSDGGRAGGSGRGR
ncbi:NAD-dependent epimerase/dehydratase family protein [Tomitella biformata]|uniref:NAD-dependent epimerase/dehydratase family protein n=1 Tax=Tomitella biformata TaxID=630403 RepID=UPI000465C472|nr:NAD-dependent epimerase/dehydratase family protein [Tomitella biformata]